MGKRSLMRLAAGAGGALALAIAAPAMAHEDPADGFNNVLAEQHHGVFAPALEQGGCEQVRIDAGEEADDLIAEDRDVWVFNASPAEFDEAGSIAKLLFEDLNGVAVTVEVPGGFPHWIGPVGNPHLLAVSVPAGWKLLDGDFNTVPPGDGSPSSTIVVTHTCPGEPGEEPSPTPTPTPGPSEEPTPGPSEEPTPAPSESPDEKPGLPVTGPGLGGLLVLSGGLLAAGIAMLAVRRRRNLSDMLDS